MPKRPQKVAKKIAPASSGKKLNKLKVLFDVVERAKYIWESTFDAIINPVMIVDRDYQIQRANVAIAEAVEKDVRSLIGKTCYKVFAGHSEPCQGCPLPFTWKSKHSASSPIEKCADGRAYQAVSFPLKGKQKDLDLFILQYRDVREERQLQSRLIQTEKMAALGVLSGGVAHEINNPLSGVLAFAQLALAQTEKGSQIYQDIQEIEKSALRCKKIVENLLEFSRQSSFEEKEEIEVAEVLRRVLPLLKIQAKEAGVFLETQVRSNLPTVLVNPNQIEQVFLNLSSNACHATPQGGKIQIVAEQEDEEFIRIDFIDTGVGIKKQDLSKIFDPFFTTKKIGSGTGLGLSITYSLIQDHGGRLEVESEENVGTTFRIFLPVMVPLKVEKIKSGFKQIS